MRPLFLAARSEIGRQRHAEAAPIFHLQRIGGKDLPALLVQGIVKHCPETDRHLAQGKVLSQAQIKRRTKIIENLLFMRFPLFILFLFFRELSVYKLLCVILNFLLNHLQLNG